MLDFQLAVPHTAILVHDKCHARPRKYANDVGPQSLVKGSETLLTICSSDNVSDGFIRKRRWLAGDDIQVLILLKLRSDCHRTQLVN